MKKILIAIMTITIVFSSCKPDVKGTLGGPSDKIAGMNGRWQLTSFVQQDPNNPIREERDLSEFYIIDGMEPYNILFSKDDMRYLVIEGPGKNYFGTLGDWALDNDDFPTYLFLYPYSPADTIELKLGNVVRTTDNELSFELENYCEDTSGIRTPTSIYRFMLTRVNE